MTTEPGDSTQPTEMDDSRLLPLGRRDVLNTLSAVAFLSGSAEAAGAEGEIGRALRHRQADASGRIGTSVSVDGDVALVGSRLRQTPPGTTPASIDVYTRIGDQWGLQTTLEGDDERGGFGAAADVSDGTALVSAPMGSTEGADSGTVTVFRRQLGEWTRTDTLSLSDPIGMEQFGRSVAIDGTTALVGSPGRREPGGPLVGAVTVYTDSGSGFRAEATLTPGNDVEEFGQSVALDGDVAAVGAHDTTDDSVGEAGTVLVFRRTDGGWVRDATLAPDRTGRDDGFGTALAIDGDSVVVGAPRENNDDGHNAGAVYVFTHDGDNWQRRRLLAPAGASDNQFGATVDVDGETVVVGAGSSVYSTEFGRVPDGSTYVFDRNGGRELDRAETEHPHLGTAVGAADGTIFASADSDDSLLDVIDL